MEIQSTSARASRNLSEHLSNTIENKPPTSDFIPDISSPSSYTQSPFQPVNEFETDQEISERTTQLKCILLGDTKCGKSSLVISYTSNGFPDQHKATAFDVYKVDINVEDRRVQLQICDTGGSSEVGSLRQLAYRDCHTFILCFSVVHPASFYSLLDRWLEEVEPYLGGAVASPTGQEPCHSGSLAAATAVHPAVLLVGCRCDERNDVAHLIDISARGESGPITEQLVRQYAGQLRANAYVECSALTQKNLKRVFDLSVWYSLRVFDERSRMLLQQQEQHHQHSSIGGGGSRKKQQQKRVSNSQHSKRSSTLASNNCAIPAAAVPTVTSNGGRNSKLKNNNSTSFETKSSWKRFFCLF